MVGNDMRMHRGLLLGLMMKACASVAWAHAVAGMRVFPGTLTFSDPGVTDELDLTYAGAALSALPHAAAPYTSLFGLNYSKTLTRRLGVSLGSTYQNLSAPQPARGLQDLAVGIDYRLWKSDTQETLVTGALNESLANTGTGAANADYSVFSPTLLFGRGLGDLPSGLKYLRPLAITGILAFNIPSSGNTPQSINWGTSVQYSLPYLQSFVRDMGLHAPFSHLVPLIEFPMQTYTTGRYAGETLGTINPGFVWIGRYGQVGLEATLPVNSASGHGVGVVLGVGFYLDDIFPHSLGTPLFPSTPQIS